MKEHLKNLDKNDIAGAIMISAVCYLTFYIIYFIQNI